MQQLLGALLGSLERGHSFLGSALRLGQRGDLPLAPLLGLGKSGHFLERFSQGGPIRASCLRISPRVPEPPGSRATSTVECVPYYSETNEVRCGDVNSVGVMMNRV